MKQLKAFALALTTIAILGPTAWAVEGNYKCPNLPGLPDVDHKFRNVKIGTDGPTLPYVESVRSFRVTESDANSPLKTIVVKGFATVTSVSDGTEILTVPPLRFEFTNGELGRCRKVL